MRYESTDLTHGKFLSSVHDSEGWESQLREEKVGILLDTNNTQCITHTLCIKDNTVS